MKLLFDNNLSVLLPEAAQLHFPGSAHVASLNLTHLSDHEIWKYARENEFTIVTKDRDFYHLATGAGSPPKVIWLTIGNCTNRQTIELIVSAAGRITAFLKSSKDLLILP